jgi:phage shock protein A/DNA-binding XRE family transcriptional regulator
MVLSLRISADIRDWLAALRGTDPAAARAVGAAVLALLDGGAALGHPAVVPLAPQLRPSEPGTVLDDAYQRQLHLLQKVRRGVADVATSRKRVELQVIVVETALVRHQAEVNDAVGARRDDLAREARARRAAAEEQLADLKSQLASLTEEEQRLTAASQRLQAKVDAFRSRKEATKARYVIRARYTAADAMRAAQEAFEAITDKLRSLLATTSEGDAAEAAAATAAVRELLEEARLAERDLRAAANARPRAGTSEPPGARQGAGPGADGRLQAPPGVMELRPSGAAGGRGHRILFRVADGEAILLARVPDDGDYELAILQAKASLQKAAGLPRYDEESFVDEFFPGEAAEVRAAADTLLARSRARTLAEARQRAGLTQAQVAARMQVRQERVSAIERAEPGATEVRTLAAYVQALGGSLEIVARVGAELIPLSSGTP